MALSNGRSLKNALKSFQKDNGREPTLAEFRKLASGRQTKVVKYIVKTEETSQKVEE